LREYQVYEEQDVSSSGEDIAALLKEVGQTLLLALLLALLIRGFLVETYLVYGPSMEPSLHEGERLLVNKLVYRFREPSPGEIVVFNEPGDNGRNLVKRVVAVSGQKLEIRNGDVFVDGSLVRETYVISASNDSLPAHEVPEEMVFVMGDNRANSLDSRYFGPVPHDYVRGRAFIIFWPLSRFNILSAVGY